MRALEAADASEPRCLSCGRRLHSARSVARRRGPRCWSTVLRAALVALAGEYSQAQIDRAWELLELGAVVPTRRRHVFRVISSDGSRTYLTAATGCNCPAGLHGRDCYHRPAVRATQRLLAA